MAECDAIVVARHVLICPDVHALWVKILKNCPKGYGQKWPIRGIKVGEGEVFEQWRCIKGNNNQSFKKIEKKFFDLKNMKKYKK